VIIVTPECEFGIAAAPPIVSLLISTPINAKGAQPLIAHGIPHTATRKVANAREWARGAKIIVAANMICEINQAVWRSGRNAVTALRAAAMPGGGRGVNRVRLVSGGWIQNGKRTELKKVMDEKTVNDRLPTRPTSPSISVALAISSLGTS
jgi:hypothetical protein